MKSYDVVGLGYACIDFLGTVPHLPELNTKLDLGTLTIQGGGPVATALVALARLGSRTLFVGKLGDDHFGGQILEGLKSEHVAVECLVAPGTTSPFAFIMVTPDGARTVLWTRGSAPFLSPDDVSPELIRSGRVLVLDDIEIPAGVRAATIAREAGIPVILGVGTPRAGIEQLIRLSDDIVMAEKFPFRLTGERDPRQALAGILRMGPKRATLTRGEQGCAHLDASGVWLEQPAFRVEAVDTTGAGDVFHGAYTYGRLAEWDTPRILRFACAVAALQTRQVGGRTAIPTLADALAFLEAHADPAVR
jgi:sulfofructose kinase